jgi:hypothetical protein
LIAITDCAVPQKLVEFGALHGEVDEFIEEQVSDFSDQIRFVFFLIILVSHSLF